MEHGLKAIEDIKKIRINSLVVPGLAAIEGGGNCINNAKNLVFKVNHGRKEQFEFRFFFYILQSFIELLLLEI
jgi:hypothetical protein